MLQKKVQLFIGLVLLVKEHYHHQVSGKFISTHLLNSLCTQREKFVETSSLQLPLKESPPEQDGTIPCGWFHVRQNSPSQNGEPRVPCDHRQLRLQRFPDYPHFSCEEVEVMKEQDRRSQSKSSKIIKGTEAGFGDFPEIVAIMADGCQICGGTIINENWVLTGARCYQKTTALKNFRVVAGGLKKSEFGTTATVQERSVLKMFPHVAWNQQNGHHGVAMWKISPPFELGKPGVEATRLPNSSAPSTSRNAPQTRESEPGVTAGWGTVSFETGAPYTDHLRYVKARVLKSVEECNETIPHGEESHPIYMREGMICAGAYGAGFCDGDIGGPLYLLDKSSRLLDGTKRGVQVGMALWGLGCGFESIPQIYADLSYYLPWIKEQMEKNP